MKVNLLICLLSVVTVCDFSHVKSENIYVQSYRLPNNSIPLRYDIWLSTDVGLRRDAFGFLGSVKIFIETLETLEEITLHMNDLEVGRINLLGSEDQVVVENLAWRYSKELNFLKIKLPRIHFKGEKIILEVNYRGELRNDKKGFYRGNYKSEKNENFWYAATQFHPISVRLAIPCFDEPQIRAVINLQIQHSEKYTAISNMPVITRYKTDNVNYVTSKFQDTPSIPISQLAFVIANFEHTSDKNLKIEQKIHANPKAIQKREGSFALGFAELMLIKYQRMFEVDFPLRKLDHVALSEHQMFGVGGLGLITYSEDILLSNSLKDVNKKRFDVNYIANMLASQFFMGMVGYKWWNSAWIGAGLSKMYERYMPSLIAPDGNFMEDYTFFYGQKTMMRDDESLRNKTLNGYVDSVEDIEDIFRGVLARRARSILWMFQDALTEETFTKGLRNFISAMKFSSANVDDFHRELQKAFDEDFPGNGIDLNASMRTWEDQSGYPIIHVEKFNEKFILTQERFGGGSEIYTIPIKYSTKLNQTAMRIWMKTRRYELEDSSDWLMLNVGWDGYYKVIYSDEILKAFSDQFMSVNDKTEIVDKKGIIQIASDLLKDTKLDSITGLKLLASLKSSSNYRIWKNAKKIFNFYNAILFGKEIYPKFQKFIKSAIRPALGKVRFEKQENETTNDADLRILMTKISCAIEQPSCISFEQKKLDNFFRGGSEISCEALKHSREEVRERVEQMLFSRKSNPNILSLHPILGCSLNQKSILKDLHQVLKAQNVKKSTKIEVFKMIQGRSLVSAETTLNFFSQNIGKIMEKLPLSSKLVLDLEIPNIEYNHKKIISILDELESVNLIDEGSYAQANKKIYERLRWIDGNIRKIIDWLENYE